MQTLIKASHFFQVLAKQSFSDLERSSFNLNDTFSWSHTNSTILTLIIQSHCDFSSATVISVHILHHWELYQCFKCVQTWITVYSNKIFNFFIISFQLFHFNIIKKLIANVRSELFKHMMHDFDKLHYWIYHFLQKLCSLKQINSKSWSSSYHSFF